MNEIRKNAAGEMNKKRIEELMGNVDAYKDAIFQAEVALDSIEEQSERMIEDSLYNSEEKENIQEEASMLNKIIVKHLFDMYDYEIDVKHKYSILHSLNGKGKTTILRLIKATIELDLFVLDIIPFKLFSLEFSNGKKIEVEKIMTTYSLIEDIVQKGSSRNEIKWNLSIVLSENKNFERITLIDANDGEFSKMIYSYIRDSYGRHVQYGREIEDYKGLVSVSCKQPKT